MRFEGQKENLNFWTVLFFVRQRGGNFIQSSIEIDYTALCAGIVSLLRRGVDRGIHLGREE